MNRRGVFVTGTDTGVGKTMVACAFAAWCRREGRDVGVMKPVATGGRRAASQGHGAWVSDDAQRLAAAARVSDPLALINPVCFQEPVAPWTAALQNHRPVRPAAIMRAFDRLALRHEVLIVEGVGGLAVPLTARIMVADLARRMELPLVIVARAGLGTLNHTLLTLAYARGAGLRVAGIVLNACDGPARDRVDRLVLETNPYVLARFGRVPIVGRLPFLGRRRAGSWDAKTLAAWAARHVARDFLDELSRD